MDEEPVNGPVSLPLITPQHFYSEELESTHHPPLSVETTRTAASIAGESRPLSDIAEFRFRCRVPEDYRVDWGIPKTSSERSCVETQYESLPVFLTLMIIPLESTVEETTLRKPNSFNSSRKEESFAWVGG
jgi:hypothetical protein